MRLVIRNVEQARPVGGHPRLEREAAGPSGSRNVAARRRTIETRLPRGPIWSVVLERQDARPNHSSAAMRASYSARISAAAMSLSSAPTWYSATQIVDQVTAEPMPSGEPMRGFASEVFLDDLPELRLDRDRRCLAMGFLPESPVQIPDSQNLTCPPSGVHSTAAAISTALISQGAGARGLVSARPMSLEKS